MKAALVTSLLAAEEASAATVTLFSLHREVDEYQYA
jgi:hypothetical protein